MIRINLIPPEIIEKRRDERRWRYILFGAIGVLAVLAVVYLALQLQVIGKQAEVASLKQEADNLQAQTSRFRIFQENEADLSKRRLVVEKVRQGRVDWARMLNELSMVLPTDTFLVSMLASEPSTASADAGKVTLTGKALDYPADSPDNGYRSVAKTLVRLTELSQLEQVWLTTTSRPSGSQAAPGTEDRIQPFIDWTILARITTEPTTTASAVPAAPAP